MTSGLLRRHPIRAALALVAVLLAIPGVSVGQALTKPGNDTVAERLAEWARDHHGGALVNLFERASYRPPKVGGRVAGLVTAAQQSWGDGDADPAARSARPAPADRPAGSAG